MNKTTTTLVKVHRRPKAILNAGRYLEKFDPKRAKNRRDRFSWSMAGWVFLNGCLPVVDLLEADRCASASDCKEDTIKSAG